MLNAETTPEDSRFEPPAALEPALRFAPEGVFDLAAAAALEGALSRLSSGVRLLLDFAGVTRVEDRALLSLARALERLPETACGITGLTLHQRSVIQYLRAR